MAEEKNRLNERAGGLGLSQKSPRPINLSALETGAGRAAIDESVCIGC